MDSRWFIRLGPEEDKTKRKEGIQNSRYILNMLQEIVEAELKTELTPRKSDYDSPSWAFCQADKNGAVRALNSVLCLLRPDKGANETNGRRTNKRSKK